MEWTVYNFECADAAARESLVGRLAETHDVEAPEPESGTHGTLADEAGEVPTDLAWVGTYVYAMTDRRVEGLLAATADLWERAVVAGFDGNAEACTEAVLYRSAAGAPDERARYEGVPELAGQDMLYRFAMTHQFRFRAYAHEPPGPMITDLFGAFDAVVGMGWGSDLMEYFERETGVGPTGPGLAFLEGDPMLAEGEFYDPDVGTDTDDASDERA